MIDTIKQQQRPHLYIIIVQGVTLKENTLPYSVGTF